MANPQTFDPLLAVQPNVASYIKSRPSTPVIPQPKLSKLEKKLQKKKDKLTGILAKYNVYNPEDLAGKYVVSKGHLVLMLGEEMIKVCPEKLEDFWPSLRNDMKRIKALMEEIDKLIQ